MTKINTTLIGKKLEDEVAFIYGQLDGVLRIEKNINIMGIQIDVYVEIESQDGIISRYAIDAKNFKKSVDSSHVRKCISDFIVLRNANKIDQGIIVSATGFTQDSHSTVRESPGVTLKEIQDLRNRIYNFTDYLQKWIKTYENSDLFLKDLYISLTARTEDGTNVGNLDKYLLDWLKDDSISHITLLGNYGTGKSTTLRYLMWKQSKKYLENPYKERIPIFIELKDFRRASETKALMTNILINEIGVNLKFIKFQELNEDGRFLIIFDGFDEMVDRVLDGLPYEHFQELNTIACKKGKIILSSRTHYFRDHNEVIEIHNQTTDLLDLTHNRPGLKFLFLNTFTKKDIQVYLKKVLNDEWEKFERIIEETYDLKSLAEVPILLNMIVQTLPEIIKNGETVNRSIIYKTFTDKWLNRDKWKRSGLTTADRLYFCKQLAFHFYVSQEYNVHWKKLPDFIRQYFKSNIKTFDDIDIFESDVRTSNFLVRDEKGGKYSFVHKSFMEYFIARFFYDSIEKMSPNGLDQLKDYTKSRVVFEFLLEMIDKEDIDILTKDIHIKEDEDLSRLISENPSQQIEYSKRIYTSPESIGNCAYLLIGLGIPVANSYLDTAIFTGLSLSDISFANVHLRKAQFDKSNLKNISFNNAKLNYANFQKAELYNVDFSKADVQGANFLDCNLDSFTLKSLASSKYWGLIKISDIQKNKISREVYKPVDIT